MFKNILEVPTDNMPPAPSRGPIYDRRTVLGQLADGERPEVVYGVDRELAAEELGIYLRSIELSEEDVWLHALRNTRQLERRYQACRNGVAFLHECYYEYGLVTGPGGVLT